MAVTENTYTGDGTTVLRSFTFPYLETTDIKVSLDGVNTTAYTLANATTIQFDTAPANGVAIRIYRETDDATLTANFYPGSAIRSQDLNSNFTQSLYVAQETRRDAEAATAEVTQGVADAALALSNSQTAINTANNAETTANTANATANSANATAATATTTATNATNTANTALNAANQAVTIADSASSTATSAQTSATNAVNTANTAEATANQALDLVSAVVDYDIISNVAAIPGSPADGDGVELLDSTGIQSFSPLTGVPSGFIGSSALRVKIRYNATGSTWEWVSYVAADPEARYVKVSGSTLTGQLLADSSSNPATPGLAFSGDANTGIYSPGADQLAISTGGTGRLFIDANGGVGINTNTSFIESIGKLVVQNGSTTADERLVVAANAYLSGPTFTATYLQQGDTATTGTTFGLSKTNLGALVFQNTSAGLIGCNGGVPLVFGTSGLERMRLDSSGKLGIGNVAPSEALEVTGNIAVSPNPGSFRVLGAGLSSDTTVVLQSGGASGTGGNIELGRDGVIVYDATNHIFRNVSGAGEYARIDSGGRLLVGTTSANQVPTGEGVNRQPYLQVGSNTYEASALSSILYAPDAIGGGSISLARSNTSTIGNQAIANSGDVAGSVFFSASDGAKQVRCAQITAQVNGTPGVDDMPGKLVFSTTADGASTPTERMRINADGSTVFSYPVTIPAGSTINGYQRNFNHISAPVNTTITDHTWVSVLAAGLTITLPASATDGMAVRISVGDFTNTVINGNGLRIMNDPSNLTIDRANVTVTLIYDNTGAGPYGWRII